MRYAKALAPLAGSLAMLILATDALAQPEEETRKEVRRRHRSAEVLFRMDEPRDESNRSWMKEHFSLRKGTGIVYSYKMPRQHDKPIVFSVGGPSLKKKRFGLLFEVRF
jgi:hypothetical protein